MAALVTDGQDWTEDLLEDIYLRLEKLAKEKYQLTFYPNQLEVITSEQMLDAYSSHGLPVFYPYWQFGETFVQNLESYKRGYMGLAYEIVINSNPCISYLMEENTMMMQTLVTAHAAFGHNTFFKNNYLFKQWTDAESIIDYLVFAKKYIKECEEEYGISEVEQILDVCNALNYNGVDKYKRPSKLSAAEEEKLKEEREKYYQSQLNDIWSTIPKRKKSIEKEHTDDEKFPSEPQENILYFVEKHAPRLKPWQREIIRIVRKISQYFYPQIHTKIMNEGCATFFHYKLVHDLYEQGVLSDGAMFEFYKSHTGVVVQLDHDHPHYSGINPYALGFEMYRDIERVSMNPTEEDREWFGNQEWVGNGDWLKNVKWAIENFKDESFIMQFLSPKIIRDFKFFNVHDDERDPMFEITAIHDKDGYKRIRSALSRQVDVGNSIPDIQVVKVDRWGDRSMTVRHFMNNGRPLEEENAQATIRYLSFLWGYPVTLESVDDEGNIKAAWTEAADHSSLDVYLDDN